MSDEKSNKTKFETAQHLLADGDMFVRFRTGYPGIRIPEKLKDTEEAILQFGRKMFIPIPDLYVTEFAVSGTLSFAGKPEYCCIPWESIVFMYGAIGSGYVFLDSRAPEAAPPAEANLSSRQKAIASKRGWRVLAGGRK